ncbi:MAG: hypothetical protein DWQ44_02470 [Bacteroidetes bacterium]|nr:MAG: hypothetical protein DWQ33_06200 [Bacteroidota bacterium]REK04835.1 MAG: hypothetical protein DWQ39_06365 [Bacteroidota bacterium]REK36307.1 MAG: hypothetical protein DWQ44_02470 [Bacteroidota bacterium]REK51027.1 MAG: hypothetical protein DWQ48_02750 [Bacteroidota bacterium]
MKIIISEAEALHIKAICDIQVESFSRLYNEVPVRNHGKLHPSGPQFNERSREINKFMADEYVKVRQNPDYLFSANPALIANFRSILDIFADEAEFDTEVVTSIMLKIDLVLFVSEHIN